MHGVDQVQVLMLPKRLGKRLVLQAAIWRATRSLGRVDSTGDRLEEPPVVVVLKEVVAQGVIDDR